MVAEKVRSHSFLRDINKELRELNIKRLEKLLDDLFKLVSVSAN